MYFLAGVAEASEKFLRTGVLRNTHKVQRIKAGKGFVLVS